MATIMNDLRRDLMTVVLVCRDRRTPWHARLTAACCVGYVFSPIQLIPDWVPILGFLDDAVVLALGVALLIKLTPREVVGQCRERAAAGLTNELTPTPLARVIAILLIALWLALAIGGSLALFHFLRR
ncbi:MAG TPA: YkvA family protein [Ktedonobacterales bacterium]|jgi:uncharacterized membrane protein YkvA (DUF1232 family)